QGGSGRIVAAMSTSGAANRLATESSPYLLQHAANPVEWYPWGEEALRRARTEQKPILLSVGYSACHWCHVMAHESFEDPSTAAAMNDHFINIKVDREERPTWTRSTRGWCSSSVPAEDGRSPSSSPQISCLSTEAPTSPRPRGMGFRRSGSWWRRWARRGRSSERRCSHRRASSSRGCGSSRRGG